MSFLCLKVKYLIIVNTSTIHLIWLGGNDRRKHNQNEYRDFYSVEVPGIAWNNRLYKIIITESKMAVKVPWFPWVFAWRQCFDFVQQGVLQAEYSLQLCLRTQTSDKKHWNHWYLCGCAMKRKSWTMWVTEVYWWTAENSWLICGCTCTGKITAYYSVNAKK